MSGFRPGRRRGAGMLRVAIGLVPVVLLGVLLAVRAGDQPGPMLGSAVVDRNALDEIAGPAGVQPVAGGRDDAAKAGSATLDLAPEEARNVERLASSAARPLRQPVAARDVLPEAAPPPGDREAPPEARLSQTADSDITVRQPTWSGRTADAGDVEIAARETAPRRPLTPNGILPLVRVPEEAGRDDDARDPLPERRAPGAERARIVIHHTGGETAGGLGSLLRSRGYAGTELRRVGVAVSAANVRYFHPSDRRIAAEVADLMRARGVPARLRDFTDFQPSPSPGTVEVWLPG